MNFARPVVKTVNFGQEDVFARRGWLASASDVLRERILKGGRQMPLVRGQRLFSAGAPPGGIYGVISGGVGAEGSSQWHSPRIGHVYRSGHWFGHGPVLHGGVRSMGFLAMEESIVLIVELEKIRDMMRSDPEVIRLVGQLATIGTDLATVAVCDLLIPAAPRRIAAVLLRVTGAHEGVEPTAPAGFYLTQSDISELANASRIYVSRVLGKFVKAGWIETSYGHIRLVDIEALAAFAYSGGE